MVKRNFKLSADISTDAKDKLLAICQKSERSRGQILERMINKFHTETFGEQKPKPPAVKKRQFKTPTVKEVSFYMLDRGLAAQIEQEAEKFCDFYEMKGWMVGKNKMKDWKAAVRNWLKGNSNEANKSGNAQASRKSSEDRVNSALEKQRTEFFGGAESMESDDPLLHNEVGNQERGGSFIELDNGDWSSN